MLLQSLISRKTGNGWLGRDISSKAYMFGCFLKKCTFCIPVAALSQAHRWGFIWSSQNTQLDQTAGENWEKWGRQWASLLWLWLSFTPAVAGHLDRVTKAPTGRGYFCRREESFSVNSELNYCCLYTIVFSQSTVLSTKKIHVREK